MDVDESLSRKLTTSSFTLPPALDELSKIAQDLKQSLTRKPTQSPFQNILQQISTLQQSSSSSSDIPPSTAEVMRDIESIESTKSVSLVTELCQLRDLLLPTPPMSTSSSPVFSPKKKFIIRSQSQTDDDIPPSNNNNSSYIQIFIDQKPYTLQVETQETNLDKIISHSNEQTLEREINTQHLKIPSLAQNMPNEVTSSDQMPPKVKRQRVTTSSSHVIQPAPITGEMNDIIRRKHIRDSNREAARRCRERRRNYIETLESSLEREREKNKTLDTELEHLKQENAQLKTILSETTKLIQ